MATKIKLIADNVITTSQIDTSSLDSHFTGGTGVTYSSGTISIGQAVATTDNVTFADLTVTGDLNITGDINSYNVTDLDVTDQTITLGAGQIEANSGGSGIIVAGSEASILWDENNDEWDFNKGLTTTGKIGIGTDNPTVKLEATDSTSPIIKLSRDGGSAATQGYTTYGHSNIGYTGGTGADTHIVSQHGIGLVINEGVGVGATALVITDGGLVGIGNTNPTRPLDVLTSSTGQVPVANFGTSGAGGQGLILGINTTTETTYLQNNTNSSYDMEFIVNANQRLLITSDGNIGINVGTPQGTLHINDPDANTDTELLIGNSGTSAGGNVLGSIWFGSAESSGHRAAGIKSTATQDFNANDTPANLSFWTTNDNTTGATQKMVITDGGLVGIDNTNPLTKLHVNGSSASTYTGNGPGDILRVSSSSVGNWIASDFNGALAYFGTDSSTSGKFAAYNYATSTEMDLVFGQSRLFISNNGRVGIGEASSGGKLHVKGEGGGSGLTLNTTDSAGNQTFFVSDGGTVGVRYAAFMVGKNNSTARANNAAIDFSGTNTSMAIPYGSTGQRSVSPSNAGYMRWNYTLEHIENWSGTGWGSIGGKSQGEQLARQYCARTGGSIRYVSAGSGSLNSDLDAISDGDALLIAPGSYTITRKTSGYVSEHNPFREKECGVFGDTNYAGDVTISHNADADTDIRDHPIWCARWDGLYTHPLFLGFIKYVRNPSTVYNTNYSDAMVNGTHSNGGTQMICGGAQNVLFDFNGTDVSWVYDNASATHYMRFKNCTFSNYNTWEGSYSGGLADGYVWHCVFEDSDSISGYTNAIGYDIATSAGSITNRTLLSKGNKHGVTLSGTGSNSGTYDVDTNAGAGHLQYDPFPTIFWDDENWPGDY